MELPVSDLKLKGFVGLGFRFHANRQSYAKAVLLQPFGACQNADLQQYQTWFYPPEQKN